MKKQNLEIRIESVYNGFLVTCHSYGLPEDEPLTTNSVQYDVPTPYGRYNNRYIAVGKDELVGLVDWLLSQNDVAFIDHTIERSKWANLEVTKNVNG